MPEEHPEPRQKQNDATRKHVVQLKPIKPLAQPVLTKQEPNQQRTSTNTAQHPPIPWNTGRGLWPRFPSAKLLPVSILVSNHYYLTTFCRQSMTFELRVNKAFVHCQRDSKLDPQGTGISGVM